MPDVGTRKPDATPELPEMNYWYFTSTMQACQYPTLVGSTLLSVETGKEREQKCTWVPVALG